MDALVKKIEERTARYAVIGLGYVGLPLAVEFARAGFEVLGVDICEEKVRSIGEGVSYVQDISSEVLAPLVSEGKITATSDFATLGEVDAISICVPTPLSKTKDPDVSYVVAATEEVARHLKPGTLVILESTTYPGTTIELLLPILSERGLKVGEDFCLAFSPERVDPGNEIYGVQNTPKVVGGVTETCTRIAALLLGQAIETVVPVSCCAAAETVKLLENTFRSVNIGLVNELAMMCDRLDIDVWEVIEAAATKPFGFMPFFPGPGLGGHCIPIDPLYLSWKLKTLNYRARFIELAGEVNSEMPDYVVSRVVKGLNEQKKPVNGSRFLVIGVAYKPDIDDVRESPALDILKILKAQGGEVAFTDPYVPTLRLNGDTLESVPLTGEGYDCAIIATDHSDIDYEAVVGMFPLVVDSRNATKGLGAPNVVKLSDMILVTGGAGFIGSHVSEALLDRGERVVVLDNLNDFYDPAIKRRNLEILAARPGFTFVEGDLRDRSGVSGLLATHRPDAVIHLAAMAGVRPSIESPTLYADVNVNGTTVLLEETVSAGVDRFVFASSSSVYGERRDPPFRESDRVDGPISPYAATKKACELLCHSFHHVAGLNITCLRYFTVYGPRQRPEMAIAKFARLLMEDRPIPMFGDGESARDYTFVSDIVNGTIRALDRLSGYRIYNLGGSGVTTLARLIEIMGRELGREPAIERLPVQAGDVSLTSACVDRAEEDLGFRPRVSIEEGIARFASWLREG